MSEVLDLLIATAFMISCTLLVRSLMTEARLPAWWWGVALVPLFCWGMAMAVLLLPRPIPPGWQEGDFDTGRADFVALVFFGALLPAAYLAIAVPTALVIRHWKRRRAAR